MVSPLFIVTFGLVLLEAAEGRNCYRCLVQNGCLSLDIYGRNVTQQCIKGVEHCVTSETKSKVTGAVAIDHMCGGRTYSMESPQLKDGCFKSVDDPGARTERTVCYCSDDFCNGAATLSAPTLALFLVLNIKALL